jgi:hypothetical protein
MEQRKALEVSQNISVADIVAERKKELEMPDLGPKGKGPKGKDSKSQGKAGPKSSAGTPGRKDAGKRKRALDSDESGSGEDDEAGSERGSRSGSASGGSDDADDLANYLRITDFTEFKDELFEIIADKEIEVKMLRAEQGAFLGENLRILHRLDKIDWGMMRKAEAMTADTLSEFRTMIDAFQKSLAHDFKHWKRKNLALQGKYENMTLWVRMFAQMNEKLKAEFFNSVRGCNETMEGILEHLKMQVHKDF